MKNLFSILFFSFVILSSSNSQTTSSTDPSYIRTINQRAGKIVSSLEIKDSAKYYRVQALIATQYQSLRNIHDSRNEAAKILKNDTTKSKTDRETSVKNLETEANSKLMELHISFLANLSKELTTTQIDLVKDGMTSGKVPFTYGGYIQMIPSLTDTQKKQIWDWLIEAREKAMDAESSEKKSGIFGNYKGRIANYLSKEGYDLKKEGEEWQKRIKAKEAEKK